MTAYCCLLVAKYGCMHARTSPTTGAASFPRHYVELGLRARAAVDSQTSCFPHLVRKDAARLVPFRMSEQTNKRKKKTASSLCPHHMVLASANAYRGKRKQVSSSSGSFCTLLLCWYPAAVRNTRTCWRRRARKICVQTTCKPLPTLPCLDRPTLPSSQEQLRESADYMSFVVLRSGNIRSL